MTRSLFRDYIDGKMATASEDRGNSAPKDQIVLRVNQLDSSELDTELHELLKAQFTRAFQFFQPGVLAYIEPELNAALRLLLWQFSINSTHSTLGQQMLNLKYAQESSSVHKLSLLQRRVYACLLIGLKWLQERSHDLALGTNHMSAFEKIWKVFHVLERLLQVASLINFLVFLQQGRYQFIYERILGIRAWFSKPQSVRQVSFEYMTRELLWHGFAEFIFFLLPFINFHRVRNFFKRHLTFFSISSSDMDVSKRRAQHLYKECAVCGEWPTCPREIGCLHVFCYYCIQSNFDADPSYTCPLCSHPVEDGSNIQQVKCEIT
ncbi:peroxisome biogenesis factor 2-like [Amphiura filiformis]|uniref:peroxisome biogenesis factor 2-like n=1 Tax=Amphiura filiformis TaxID=82378 RepID=UPI003B215D20